MSEVSSGFAYFLLTFAYEPVLALCSVSLGVEFDSASHGGLFSTCCPAEKRSLTPNTGSNPRYSRYSLLAFAPGLVLELQLLLPLVDDNAGYDRSGKFRFQCSSFYSSQ